MYSKSSLSESKIVKYSNDYCDAFTYGLYAELGKTISNLEFAIVTTDDQNWVFLCVKDNRTYISAAGWGDENSILDDETYVSMFDEDELGEEYNVHLHSFPLTRLSDYTFVKDSDVSQDILVDARTVAAEYLKSAGR